MHPGGMIALNVAATPGDRKLSDAVGTTLLTAFRRAWRWHALRYNDVLFALREPVTRAARDQRAGRARGKLRLLLPLFHSLLAPVRPHGSALTDDRAPVEWLTDRMIIHEVERGGVHEEPALPTAPGR